MDERKFSLSSELTTNADLQRPSVGNRAEASSELNAVFIKDGSLRVLDEIPEKLTDPATIFWGFIWGVVWAILLKEYKRLLAYKRRFLLAAEVGFYVLMMFGVSLTAVIVFPFITGLFLNGPTSIGITSLSLNWPLTALD